MPEINGQNNNINAIRFQKTELKKEQLKEQAGLDENGEESLKFASAKAASLGRTQVSKPDNLENDIKFLLKNPELVSQANMFFDNAYEMLKAKNEEKAYEKASQMMQAFSEEFIKLKK